jgi:hypothetical protein
MGKKSRFVCCLTKLVWHLRAVVPFCEATALSRRLPASVEFVDDSNVKVGFMKKCGEPPLMIAQYASQERYLLDHVEELGLRVLDMQREKPYIRAKILEWEAEDQAIRDEHKAAEKLLVREQTDRSNVHLRQCMFWRCNKREAFCKQFRVCSKCMENAYFEKCESVGACGSVHPAPNGG